MPGHLQPAVLLGAFVGLRVAEACGLRSDDVDFMRGIVTPAVQYPVDGLMADTSRKPVPIPRELATLLAAGTVSGTWSLRTPVGGQVGPWQIERTVRGARTVVGLPDRFRYNDPGHRPACGTRALHDHDQDRKSVV